MHRRSFIASTILVLMACRVVAAERYECLIEPWDVVEVGARSTGILSELLVDRGHFVEKGQEIARLNSDIEAASLRLARERANSTIAIDLAQARSDYEKLNLERARTLAERAVASQQDLDTAEATYEVSRLQIVEAQSQKKLAELELERVQALYDLRTIRSPIGGVIVAKSRAPGEFLSENDNVAIIARIDPLQVQAYLPLDVIGRIKVGDAVTVFPQEPIGGEFPGTVDVVDRVVDARSGTIGVRVKMANPDLQTLAGLRCDLEVGE